ncbi:MAG: ABC transporter substrate-binding protein [Nitrospinota bacterium]
MRIHRKRFGAKMMIVGIAVLALLLAVSVPSARAAEKVSFRLSWLVQAIFSPFYMGLDKGFYKAEGIDLAIQEGRGSSLSAKLVAQKKDAFGISDAGVVIKSIEKGFPIKIFWLHYQQNPMAVLSIKGKGIRGPKDLIGKKVAGSARASFTILFPSLLKRNGIDPSKVEVFNTNPPFHPLVLGGKVDAMLGYWMDNKPKLEEFGVEVEVVKYYDWGMNTLSNGLITHVDTLANQPDLVRRFVRATARSWEYARTHIKESIDSLMPRMQKGKRSTQTKTLENMMQILHTKNTQGKPLGWMSPKDWQDTVDNLYQTGLIKSKSPIGRYFTNDFVQGS